MVSHRRPARSLTTVTVHLNQPLHRPQLHPGHEVTSDEIRAFVKDRLGSVKAPKQVEVWPDLPRSKVGKVLKLEVKAQFL